MVLHAALDRGDANPRSAPTIAIIGGGPAGLMAAEVARAAGVEVHVYDRMGSVGRKFLIAGKGGLNLTHSENFAAFVVRYGAREKEIRAWLAQFDADALREWARSLGLALIGWQRLNRSVGPRGLQEIRACDVAGARGVIDVADAAKVGWRH